MSTQRLCQPKVNPLPSHLKLSRDLYTDSLTTLLPTHKSSRHSQLEELKFIVFTDQKPTKSLPSSQEVTILKKNLSRAILEQNQDLLITSLLSFQRYCISKDTLKSTKLLKILKYFIKNCEKNEDVLFDGLLDVVKYIFCKWKLISIQNDQVDETDNDKEYSEIPEVDEKTLIRLEVVKRTAKILNENGFDVFEAEKLAGIIEEGLVKRDPDLELKYKKLARAMLRDIKHLDKRSFEKVCAS